MAKVKPEHHRGTHQRRARAVVTQANSSTLTVCWRCGKTLAQHQPHHNGRRPWWTAGHVIDGLTDGPLAPEASTCNMSAGATVGNARRKRTDLTW